jgi:signal transduction histidine kinase
LRLDAVREAGPGESSAVWGDLAAAAALTLGGQLELAYSGQAGWHGLVHGLLLLAQTAPVAVRRVLPATAATIGASALALEAVASTPTNTLSGLLAGLLLLYAVGRNVTGARLVMVSGGMGIGIVLHMLLLPGTEVSDLAFAVIFSSAAWLAGRTVRRREHDRRQAEADAVARQAAALADERTRIARELHDIVAHGVGVMVVQAGAAEQMLESDPSAAREPLSAVRQTGQGALAEMRRLLGLLRHGGEAEGTTPQPSLSQLPALVRQLESAGMPITSSITGDLATLPDGIQVCAYRILQEALTNCLKHSAGAATHVSVRRDSSRLDIDVLNEAPAATSPTTSSGRSGHGLPGMRERVRVYGGTIVAEARPGGGFHVHATLPSTP